MTSLGYTSVTSDNTVTMTVTSHREGHKRFWKDNII